MIEDLTSIRRFNVEMLRNGFDTITLFAENLKKNKIQVASWLREKDPRAIGDELARDIEERTDKKSGWLDKVHSKSDYEAWALKERAMNASHTMKRKVKSGAIDGPKMSKIEKIIKNA